VLQAVVPVSYVIVTPCCFAHDTEDGSRMSLRNVSTHLRDLDADNPQDHCLNSTKVRFKFFGRGGGDILDRYEHLNVPNDALPPINFIYIRSVASNKVT
jgi:hypothetical protein